MACIYEISGMKFKTIGRDAREISRNAISLRLILRVTERNLCSQRISPCLPRIEHKDASRESGFTGTSRKAHKQRRNFGPALSRFRAAGLCRRRGVAISVFGVWKIS